MQRYRMTHAHDDTMVSYWVYILPAFPFLAVKSHRRQKKKWYQRAVNELFICLFIFQSFVSLISSFFLSPFLSFPFLSLFPFPFSFPPLF